MGVLGIDCLCIFCSGKGFETNDLDVIVCPHCAAEYDNTFIDVYESQDFKCYHCSNEFGIEVEVELSFSTTKKG